MGYADNVAGGQARETNRLLEKQIAVSLETNKLLRQLLNSQGVRTVEPPVGSPAGDFKEPGIGERIRKTF